MRKHGVLLLCLLASACHRSPEGLREWKAEDHDQPETVAENQSTGEPQAHGAVEGLDDVTIVAWRNSCTRCHGGMGRGDGMQTGPVRPRDFGDAAWQAATTDEQIAETITHGRGAMPPFAFPPSTVAGLVKLVRLLGQMAQGKGEAPAPAAPEPSGSSAAAPTPSTGSPP